MRIAVIANGAWYLYNFRLRLMQDLRRAGHDVVAISPVDKYVAPLLEQGFEHRPLALAASGTNPLKELGTLLGLRRLLKHGRFQAAFTYTPKVNIYTGLAVRGLDISHVPNVSGLGRTFIHKNWLTALVKQLYILAFRPAHLVLFQNDDDRREFIRLGLVQMERTGRLPGSGVDLSRFTPQPAGKTNDRIRVLFIGRVLADKGIHELVHAARVIRSTDPRVEFQILGSADAANPSVISAQLFNEWVKSGVVTYLGVRDDVRDAISQADCVVLPSYREGVPRSLLEAAAMGKPCIATDVPGCRDAVDHGKTGLLCAPRSGEALAEALLEFLRMPKAAQLEMGRQGRLKVEKEFDEQIVLERYLNLAAELAARI